jgi:hypothetical protein
MSKNKIPNHVSEYFNAVEQNQQTRSSKELFSAEDEDIDLKTDIDHNEIRNIATLHVNDMYLKSIGLKPVFNKYHHKFMRLVISKDRKSRQEFVNLNKQDNTEDAIANLSNLSNLTGAKK